MVAMIAARIMAGTTHSPFPPPSPGRAKFFRLKAMFDLLFCLIAAKIQGKINFSSAVFFCQVL
jgi:hypothetical protein